MRHICFWQHQLLQRGWWASKKLVMEFALNVTRLAESLGRKVLLPGLLDSVLYEPDMLDPQKSDWLLNFSKSGKVLQGSCFMKESARHSAGHRRKWLINCQYKWNCLWNFLLHGKVWWILWACRLKMDAPMLHKNFGWLSRQWLLTMHFLFT